MSELSVMDRGGDTKTIWDPTNQDEVDVARHTFDTFKGKGFVAYSVDESGNKGEVIRTFDPEAGRIIMAPPLQGG